MNKTIITGDSLGNALYHREFVLRGQQPDNNYLDYREDRVSEVSISVATEENRYESVTYRTVVTVLLRNLFMQYRAPSIPI